MLSRTERLLGKSEEKLLAALERVRAKKAEEEALVARMMAEGKIWTPEGLAAKVKNMKEIRRELYRERRQSSVADQCVKRKRYARAGELSVHLISYSQNKPT